jgi:HK97 family phage prohead protease
MSTQADTVPEKDDRVRDASAGGRVGRPAGVLSEAEAPHGLYVRSLYVREVRLAEREVDAVASTEALDSYGEIVRANWDLTRFKANPVILWAHNRSEDKLPVGHAKNVRVEGNQLLMTVVFDAVTDFDEHVFKKYVNGTLKGFSVGFNPRSIRVEKVDGEEVVVLDDNELFEVSCVPIPSNPEALAKTRTRALEAAREAARCGPSQAPAATTPAATTPAATSPTPASPAPESPASPNPVAPTPASPGRTTHSPKGTTMKEGRIKKAGDLTCSVECPHCTEDFEMSVEVLPVSPKKAAELAEERSLRAAAESRVQALEARETELADQLLAARAQLATSEVDGLIGVKLFPAERDTQLELARMYLGQKDGDAKWAKHVDSLRARPDLKLLGASVVGKDTTPPATSTPERGTTAAPGGSRFAVRVAKEAAPAP